MKRILLLVLLSALALVLAAASARGSGSGSLVVAEVFAAGGNSGAAYANDYVELFNRVREPVALDGWTLQYASAAGTTWQATALSGTIPPAAATSSSSPRAERTGRRCRRPTRPAPRTSLSPAARSRSSTTRPRCPAAPRPGAARPASGRGPRRLRRRGRLRGQRCCAGGERDDGARPGGRRLHGHGRQRGRLRRRGARSAELVCGGRPCSVTPAGRTERVGRASTSTSSRCSRSRSTMPTLSFPAAVPGTTRTRCRSTSR